MIWCGEQLKCIYVDWLIKRLLKGHLISKWFFASSISSKKRTNKFDFTTMIPQVDIFSFVFWRKSTIPKNHFEINWPLGNQYFIYSKSESQYKLFDQSVIVDEKNEISIYSWINAFVAKTYAQLAEKQISLCKVGTLFLGLSIKRVLK